ncbi:DUF433 domain-containing protein [Microcoleus sp. N9_B4]|jgi:uncharacterized protein (DUF433 family)|uniref:DUF433 domain-containing protein n=1 Tax=Microcoleus sp. N9_B4 TaxID=3055386 RepID=UPI002FD6E8CE
MPLTATEYKYVELDEKNVPIIAGTTMKVIELVQAHIAYGWSPAELHLNHRYLTMSQIHSAFAYYWDHKQELDADMQRRFEYAEKLRLEAGESQAAKKLRAQGLIK